MNLILDDAGRDDLIDAMADVSADLVPAVTARDHERVAELLAPYGLIPLRALAIAQAARIHVLTDSPRDAVPVKRAPAGRRRRERGADEAPADPTPTEALEL